MSPRQHRTENVHFGRLTLRLPVNEMELLRTTAFRRHQPLAVMIRDLLLMCIKNGNLPASAPPFQEQLGSNARDCLETCHELVAILPSLKQHLIHSSAHVKSLFQDGLKIDEFGESARQLGLSIKRGEMDENCCLLLKKRISRTLQSIRRLLISLNEQPELVNFSAWGVVFYALDVSFPSR